MANGCWFIFGIDKLYCNNEWQWVIKLEYMIKKSCSSLYVKIMLIIDHEMNVNNKSLITILFVFLMFHT